MRVCACCACPSFVLNDQRWHGNRIPKCTQAIVHPPVFVDYPYATMHGRSESECSVPDVPDMPDVPDVLDDDATRVGLSAYFDETTSAVDGGAGGDGLNKTIPRTCFEIAAEKQYDDARGEGWLYVNITYKDGAPLKACNEMMQEDYSGGLKANVDNGRAVLTVFMRRFAAVPELQQSQLSLTAVGSSADGIAVHSKPVRGFGAVPTEIRYILDTTQDGFATSLPDGLRLDAVTGTLNGKPVADAVGTWELGFSVIDELSGEMHRLTDMVLEVHAPLVAEGISLVKTVNVSFKGPDLVVSGGAPDGPITFRKSTLAPFAAAASQLPLWLEFDVSNGFVAGVPDTVGKWLVHLEAVDANHASVQMPPVSVEIIRPLQIRLTLAASSSDVQREIGMPLPSSPPQSSAVAGMVASYRLSRVPANGTKNALYGGALQDLVLWVQPGAFYHPLDNTYTIVPVPQEHEAFDPEATLVVGSNVHGLGVRIVPQSIVHFSQCGAADLGDTDADDGGCFDGYTAMLQFNATEPFLSSGRLQFIIAADNAETQTPTAHVADEDGNLLIFSVEVNGCRPGHCSNGGVCRYSAGNAFGECDCAGTGFTHGAASGQCDEENSSEAEAKAATKTAKTVAGALSGVVVLLLLVSAVIYKRQRQSTAELKGVMQTLEEFVPPYVYVIVMSHSDES